MDHVYFIRWFFFSITPPVTGKNPEIVLFSDGCDIFVITRMLFSDTLLELRSRVWFVMKPANVYTQNDIVVQKVGFAKGGWDLKKKSRGNGYQVVFWGCVWDGVLPFGCILWEAGCDLGF